MLWFISCITHAYAHVIQMALKLTHVNVLNNIFVICNIKAHNIHYPYVALFGMAVHAYPARTLPGQR